MQKNEITISTLINKLGGKLFGDGSIIINSFSSIEKSCLQTASFASLNCDERLLLSCKSSLLIISPKTKNLENIINERLKKNLATIIFENPKLFFSRAISLLDEIYNINANLKINSTAKIHETVKLGSNVSIGANVIIEEGVQIGSKSKVCEFSYIGKNSRLGKNCLIHPRVTIKKNTDVADEVILHSGVVLGSDGFGFVLNENHKWEKVPQIGNVVISSNVEIGANSVVDRGTIDSTIISKNVKIDNLVQIAHNVKIGENTIIAGCVGIAGSTVIGKNCQIGGGAGILDHLKIPDSTIIGPMTTVYSSIKKSGKYVGVYPIQKDYEWKKTSILLKKLITIKEKFWKK